MTRTDRIAKSFARASATYDGQAQLQEIVAAALAKRVLASPWNSPRVLEIGCGTGGLTRLLMPRIAGQWIVTDIAPAMIDAARSALPPSDVQFRVMNGEAPDIPPESVDLIVSSLAAQWFEDLPQALTRLCRCLAPGGRLLLTTLGAASLTEWRDALAATGHGSGRPDYPSAQSLQAALQPNGNVSSDLVRMDYADGGAFLRMLKGIGATTPAMGYRPLPVGAIRQAMTRMGAPCTITYEILTVDMGK